MGPRRTARRPRWAICLAALVVAALTLGASGGDTKLKNLGHGVTKDKIKIGFAVIDYESIAEHVDFERGDQLETLQIFVDYVNDSGGILGREVEAYPKVYPPIPGMSPDPLTLCTAWTEDDDVFAVLGVFIDFSGQGQLCLTKEHNTVHIGHELEQTWIDQAPAGLLLTPGGTKESAATSLINLLVQEGKLKGKTVGFLADQNSEGRVNDLVVPALEKAKVKTGSTAVLSITGTDTSAAQAQLDSFIEKWKSEKVNTIYMAGLTIAAKQFVEKIKEAMPDALLITDSSATDRQAQDEVKAGKNPNPYEGMLAVTGESAADSWKDKRPLLEECVNVYEKATGKTIPSPDAPEVTSAGKTVELYVAVTDFCEELLMFRQIAEKVGPNLTTKNWQKAVNKFGAIQLAGTDAASICKGKYAADDAVRLVEFDSSVGEVGDWSAVTPIKDASGGFCTKKASPAGS